MANGKDPMLDFMPGATHVRMPTGLEAQRAQDRAEWERLGPVTAEFNQRDPDTGPRQAKAPKPEWRQQINHLGDNHKRMTPSRLENAGSAWAKEKRESDQAQLEAEAKAQASEVARIQKAIEARVKAEKGAEKSTKSVGA